MRRQGWKNGRWGYVTALTVLLCPLWAFSQTVRQVDPDTAGGLQRVSVPKPTVASAADDAPRLFETIGAAWMAGDHTALAGAVSAEGVLIAIAPQMDRENVYSRSQSFYFFKNIFQTTQTDTFEFQRVQEEADEGLVHAVAKWKYRRTGSDAIFSERLFITLARGRDGWGLSEVRTLR
jgi:hypothetical protein